MNTPHLTWDKVQYEMGKWVEHDETIGDCVSMVNMRDTLMDMTYYDKEHDVAYHVVDFFFLCCFLRVSLRTMITFLLSGTWLNLIKKARFICMQ